MCGLNEDFNKKKLRDLTPYENNPRNNDAAVELVANSIKEFGFKNPIIIDKNGRGTGKVKVVKKYLPPSLAAIRAIKRMIENGEWESD